MGCLIVHTPEGARLTGAIRDRMMAVAVTCKTFRPPFTVRTVAQTDSTNLRLYRHVGEIIFNWECSVRRLKVHDPATGQWWDGEDEGFIEVNQWHEIRGGEWGSIEAPVAIGPCFGSTVTVRSFTIE